MRSKHLDDLIQVRIASTDKRRLMEMARKEGLSLSTFLRLSASRLAQRIAA